MGREKHYFILNPNACNQGSLAVWKELRTQLTLAAIPFEMLLTAYPGHATKLVRSVLEKHDDARITAIGGDGTFFEVINGAVGFPAASLGFIGAGSGNDFCRGARIPMKPDAALSYITAEPQVTASLDCGAFVTDHCGYFASSVGLGVDAVVTEAVNKSTLKTKFNRLKIGKLIYLFLFLQSIWRFSRPCVEVVVDGVHRHYKDVWLVNIANNPYFGGGIKVSPDAQMDDGLFHVMVVHSYSRWMLLCMFVSVIWGGHRRLKKVTFVTGKQITLKSNCDTPIHADGETIGRREVTVSVVPAAVNVVCSYGDK